MSSIRAIKRKVEIIERDGKKYWTCPHCDMETAIVDEVFPSVKRKT